MSSSHSRKPAFRLVFDDALATLYGPAGPAPMRTVPLGADAFAAGLRDIGAVVRTAGGRLTVALPASEVWRGGLDLAGMTRLARWRTARKAASRGLGLPPASLRVGLGAPETDGRRIVAAVRRRTLAETRAYLGSVGIDVAHFEVADSLGLPIVLPEGRGAPSARTIAVGGALAAASVALFLGTGATPPAPEAPRADRLEAEIAEPLVPVAAAVSQSAALLSVDAPPPRPVRPASQPPAVASEDPAPPDAPAAAVRPDLPAAPPVTKAARDLPGLAVTMGSRSGSFAVTPRPRPHTAALETAPVEATIALAALPRSDDAGLRPLRRPAAPAAAAAPAPEPVAATPAPPLVADPSAILQPRPRPRATGAPSAALSSAITDAVASAQAPPVATVATTLRPEPRRIAPRPAAAKPVVFAAEQPTVLRQTAAQPKPVRTAAVVPPPPALKPAVVQQPKPQPTAVRRSVPLRERVGLNRRQVSLIGVFGEAGGRYALVRMPNGNVHRVRPGDRVDGAQVAAIDRSSIQLAGHGNNVVLSMP